AWTSRADARQLGTELPAAAVDHMTRAARGLKDPLAVVAVAGRWRGGSRRSHRAHVSEHLPDLAVRHAQRVGGRHVGAGYAVADGVEDAVVGDARCPEAGQI